MNSLNARLLVRALATFYAAGCLGTAYAQSTQQDNQDSATLPTVMISGSKRGSAAALEQLNGAASVAHRVDLDDAQITSTLELDRVFPELYMSHSGTILFPIITLRGVTSAQDFYNPALSVYVDGVPQLPTFAAQSLLSVEQVELLKGPQGTLYGKSAQGGVLNIVTHKPDDTPQLIARGGLSSRNSYLLQAEGSGPLVQDLLYGSVSLLANDINGDMRSDVIGSDRLDGVRSRAGNVRLRLAPTGKPWEMGLSAGRDCARGDQNVYTRFDDIKSRTAYVLPDLPEAYRDFYLRRCANSFAATGQYDFDAWRLSTVLSNQRLNSDNRYPLDVYFPQVAEDWKQNTQEIRLATLGAEAGADSQRAWDAVFGLYRQEVDLSRGYLLDIVMPSVFRATDSDSSNRTESLAVYGDVTWHLTSRMDLTPGLRFTHDRARTSFRGDQMGDTFQGRGSASQNTWLGHIATGYQFSPQWRGYINVAQGYKPLGYNLAPTNLSDASGYQREQSISYETGMRYTEQDVRASLALYRIDTKDVQLYSGDMGLQTLRNMGDTRSIGVEFNVEWDVTRQWTLAAGGFINDASFRRFTDSSTCVGCQDNGVPMTPRHGLTVSAKGNLLLGGATLRPQLTVRRTGSHYFDSANTLRQDAYTVIDAALAWNPTQALELALYAHNLTDKTYRTYGFSYGPTGDFAQVAPGRTVGLTATYMY